MKICDELRASVLQAAIQGKLTKQLPEDGDAKDLLARIAKDKERFIKDKKIRPEKPLAKVSEDDVDFDIPNSWTWTRFGNVGFFVRGNGIRRSETVKEGFPCVRYGQMYTTYKNSFRSAVSFVPKDIYDKSVKVNHGNVLMALTGENNVDIALAVAYLGEESIAMGGDMTKFVHPIAPMYVVIVVNSAHGITYKSSVAKGNIIVHISNDLLANMPFPLPPLAEQHRIVARVEELMAKIDELEVIVKEYDSL